MRVKNRHSGAYGTARCIPLGIVVTEDNMVQHTYCSVDDFAANWVSCNNAMINGVRYWFIDSTGKPKSGIYQELDTTCQAHLELGNFFKSQAEAESAAKKIFAFVRLLTHNGFKCKTWGYSSFGENPTKYRGTIKFLATDASELAPNLSDAFPRLFNTDDEGDDDE